MLADQLSRFFRKLSFLHAITELMHGLLLISGLAVLPFAFSRDHFPLVISWMSFSFVILFLIRRLSKKIWQILLLSILITASPLLPVWDLPLIPQIILVLTLLLMAIRSFAIRINAQDPDPSNLLVAQGGALLYMLALNLFVIYFDFILLSQAYFYIAIVYLIASVYRFHNDSLNSQMSRFMTMPTQPAHRIKQFNQMMMLAFGLVMVVLLLISPLLHLHDLVPMLGSLLLAFLRWLAKVLSSDEPIPEEPIPEETQPDVSMEPGMMPEAKDPALWMVILQEIFYYLMVILTVAALLAIIVGVIISIYKRFYATDHGPDVFESLMPRIGEDVKTRLKRTRSRFLRQFGRGHDQKIRRIYWRVLDRLAQRGLEYNNKQSLRQYAYYVRKERSIDILEMTKLYEKARYGPDPCSAEDLATMQKLFQRWRQNRNESSGWNEGDYDQ